MLHDIVTPINITHVDWIIMKKTSIALFICLGVFFLLIPAFTTAADNEELTPITIAFEGTPTQNYLNTVIDENGFYAKNGLEVTPKYYDTAKEAAMSVINGESDFAIVNTYAIAEAVSEGYKPVILSSVFRTEGVNFIIVDENSGIVTAQDLAGKRIGIDPSSFWEYYMDQFLILNGIDKSSIKFVPVQNTEVVQKMLAGEIDAGTGIYQEAANIRKIDPLRYQMWSVNNNENFYLALISSQEMTENPEVIKKLITSLMDFGDYINENYEEMQQLIGSKSGVDSEAAQDLISGVSTEVSLTYGLLSVLEAQSRHIIEQGRGNITETPDYLQLIDFSYLDEINPEGVTIIHN